MKRIIGIAAILLIWVGSLSAAELKVKVPVDEYEQMKTRLEDLERKNQELQGEVDSLSEKTTDAKMKEELEKIARENQELQERVNSLKEKTSEEVSYTKEKDSRIEALGRENRRLKTTVTSLKQSGTVLRSDRRTARQVYFEANKKFATHIYK